MHRQEFDDNKFLVIRNFFDKRHVERMSKRISFLKKINKLKEDEYCTLSKSIYSDTVNSEYQELYREKLENIIGYSLYPTYNFCRVYVGKETLQKHIDRFSCEISLTSTLDYNTFDDEPWDICLDPDIKIKLYPGDILVYKGCEITHWREKFIGIQQTQVFMHYVDVNGPYTECKYDYRASLGAKEASGEIRIKGEEKISESINAQETIRTSNNAGPLQQGRT
jgi:hypothetical protein